MFNKILAVAGLALLSQIANATPISNSEEGLESPVVTITFDEHEFDIGSPVTNEFSDLGVTFFPNLYYSSQTDDEDADAFPNITGNDVTNFGSGPDVFQFSLMFLTEQTDVAFAMVSNSTSWSFEALLDSAVIESFSTGVDISEANFFGFTGITFNEIRITSLEEDFMIIDNLQIGNAQNVPEPATLALLGMAMSGLWVSRRRVKLA